MLILLFFPIATVMSNIKCQLKMKSMKVKGKGIPQHYRKLNITYRVLTKNEQEAEDDMKKCFHLSLFFLFHT